jgi:hypothetical protein
VILYKLDFIVFDAYFIGSLEMCYELKDKTDYIVALLAEVLVSGLVYSTMMQHLFEPNVGGCLKIVCLFLIIHAAI